MIRALAITLSLALAIPNPAQAWWNRGWGWHGGVVFGVVPPPIYLGPPIYYAPPPVYYAPRPAAQTCYAGPYICPLNAPGPYGGNCSCPTNNGRAYGVAR